jgi:hypothetical protein
MKRDDFDRFAALDEIKKEIARDSAKIRHEVLHHPDYPADECEFCQEEKETE